MAWTIYRGDPDQGKTGESPPPPLGKNLDDPSGYLAEEGLREAVNVALHLGQPLLLTGSPGTGKTQLAASLAWELELEPVLKFETKSSSAARDLFYTYDTVGRFHSAQVQDKDARPVDFLSYNALGLAIVLTRRRSERQGVLPPEFPASAEVLGKDFEDDWQPRRSVVLIDEVDKASRDFPNDVLNEIERFYFRIPEVENRIVDADRDLRPIVIITSNLEKSLPPAFLRRCVFYDIPFPERERLEKIVQQRITELRDGESALLASALDYFDLLARRDSGIGQPPGTAELLSWLTVLGKRGIEPGQNLREVESSFLGHTLGTLLKNGNDRQRGLDLLKGFQG